MRGRAAESVEQLFVDFQRSRDADKLGQVYDRVAPDLLRVALHLVGSAADAEDVLQATFLEVIARADRFDARRPLRPWLVGILTNQACSHRARAARAPDPGRVSQPRATPPDARARQGELDEHVGQALDRLRPPYHGVLTLRLRHGLGPAEIAHALGRPPGTVRAQLARGLELLRALLPAGLAGGALALLGRSARGLPGVRAAVLAHAGASPAASLAWLPGVLLMKKCIAFAVVLGAAVLIWRVGESALAGGRRAPARLASQPAPPPRVSPSPAAPVNAGAARSPAGPSARRPGPSPRPTPPAPAARPAPARLVVEALGAADDRPAHGVLVLLDTYAAGSGESARGGSFETRRETTGRDGVARFESVPPGPIHVRLLRGVGVDATLESGKSTRVALRLLDGPTVDVEVVDELGRAVPGAEVWLSERWRRNAAHRVGRADAAGRFRLESVTADHFVGARLPDRAPSALRSVRGGAGDVVALRLVLDAPGARVAGVVVDEYGMGVAHARLLVGTEEPPGERLPDGSFDAGRPALRARADADGRFDVEGVPLGVQPVAARAPGFAPTSSLVEVVGVDLPELTLVLERGASVRGMVRGADGEPVPRCRIESVPSETFASTRVFSGEDGRFELAGLAASPLRLLAVHDEHGQAEIELELRPAQVAVWDPTLGLRPRFHGVLLDESGAPLARRAVVALPEPTGDRRFRSAPTDEDGRFHVAVENDAPHTLWVQGAGGWRSFPSRILEGLRPSARPLTIRVDSTSGSSGTLAARVEGPGGEPVEGARLSLWHAERRLWREFPSDSSGSIEIGEVPAGTLELVLRSESHPWRRLGSHPLEAAGRLDLGTITLAPAGFVEGLVFGVGESELASLRWLVTGPDGLESSVVRPEGDSFRSGPLAPGVHVLHVRGDGFRSARREVEVVAGETTRVDVAFERAGQRDVVFHPPPSARPPRHMFCVVLDRAGGEVWREAVVRPDEDGSLRCRVSVVPGRYRLEAETNNGLRASAELAVTGWSGEDEPLVVPLAR